MTPTREQVYEALFALLQSAAAFTTASRRLRSWEDCLAAQKPALFMREPKELIQRKRGSPTKAELNVEIEVYCNAPDAQAPALPVLNGILDALDAALQPTTGPDIAWNAQTLGGLVSECAVNGEIIKYEGAQDGIAAASIPIRIILSSVT